MSEHIPISSTDMRAYLGDEDYERLLANLNKPFVPTAFYMSAMGQLIYLNEDCSYRTKYIDPNMDVLLAPYEDRIVGFQLWGFRAILKKELPEVLTLREIMASFGRYFGKWLMWKKYYLFLQLKRRFLKA